MAGLLIRLLKNFLRGGNMGDYCVLYCRVSTKDQEEKGLSLDAQEDLLREYAEENHFQIVKLFRGNESAKAPGRNHSWKATQRG